MPIGRIALTRRFKSDFAKAAFWGSTKKSAWLLNPEYIEDLNP